MKFLPDNYGVTSTPRRSAIEIETFRNKQPAVLRFSKASLKTLVTKYSL